MLECICSLGQVWQHFALFVGRKPFLFLLLLYMTVFIVNNFIDQSVNEGEELTFTGFSVERTALALQPQQCAMF